MTLSHTQYIINRDFPDGLECMARMRLSGASGNPRRPVNTTNGAPQRSLGKANPLRAWFGTPVASGILGSLCHLYRSETSTQIRPKRHQIGISSGKCALNFRVCAMQGRSLAKCLAL